MQSRSANQFIHNYCQLTEYIPSYSQEPVYTSFSHYSSQQATTYLLTYSMVRSPSSEANWFAASQEIPRNSRNPKVHYRTHKRPPPVSIVGQPNPVRIPTSHLLEIHPMLRDVSSRNTPPPRRSEWGSSLPPDCFVSRASIPHVSVS